MTTPSTRKGCSKKPMIEKGRERGTEPELIGGYRLRESETQRETEKCQRQRQSVRVINNLSLLWVPLKHQSTAVELSLCLSVCCRLQCHKVLHIVTTSSLIWHLTERQRQSERVSEREGREGGREGRGRVGREGGPR
eukprot:COSAG03_NODE_6491_length_1052_cov_4.290661_2_plen_137_part_00